MGGLGILENSESCPEPSVLQVEDMAGAAGGEGEGVQENLEKKMLNRLINWQFSVPHLSTHTEDHQLVVQVGLPALGHLEGTNKETQKKCQQIKNC